MNNRGIRSGRERSSPTWGHGCRGVTGRRKPVDLAHGYEGPPLVFPPHPLVSWKFIAEVFVAVAVNYLDLHIVAHFDLQVEVVLD